jgi:uncharacterized membrane protein YozB (DUF420 family)
MKPEAPLWLPLLNATLIVVSGLFLTIGYIFIRRKQVQLHRRSMITATVFAGLFLVVYVTRYLLFDTKIFAGDGVVRIAYLTTADTGRWPGSQHRSGPTWSSRAGSST